MQAPSYSACSYRCSQTLFIPGKKAEEQQISPIYNFSENMNNSQLG